MKTKVTFKSMLPTVHKLYESPQPTIWDQQGSLSDSGYINSFLDEIFDIQKYLYEDGHTDLVLDFCYCALQDIIAYKAKLQSEAAVAVRPE